MDMRDSKLNIVCVLCIIVFMCSSCGKHQIRDYILDFYSIEQNKDSILSLDFSKIINDSYTDYYYISCDYCPAEYISEMIGRKYNKESSEDQCRLVFYEGEKVVYEELFDKRSGPILSNILDAFMHNPQIKVRTTKITIMGESKSYPVFIK